jgi:hypothetical protein
MAVRTALTIGIGLPNASEGQAVVVTLLSCEYSRPRSFAVAGPTWLIEPIACFFGAHAVSPRLIWFFLGLSHCRWSDDLYRQPQKSSPYNHRPGFDARPDGRFGYHGFLTCPLDERGDPG